MRMRFALLVPLLLPGACHIGPGRRLPARLDQVPGPSDPLQKELDGARRLATAGETRAALDRVEGLLQRAPQHVGCQRLRQDLLRQRGRAGLVLHEATQRLAERPDSAAALYLRGRLARLPEDREGYFDAAIEAEPEVFWGWYGKAFSLRLHAPERAQALYRALFKATGRQDLNTGVALAASLRLRPQTTQLAVGVYGVLARRDKGLGSLGLAEVLVRAGKLPQAWSHLLAALRARPFDPGVRNLIAQLHGRGLAPDARAEILDVLEADPRRLQAFVHAGPGLCAALYQQAGDPGMAVHLLRRARQLDPADRRLYRHLLLRIGRVRACLADLRDDFVDEFLSNEENQVRTRWQALFQGPWMEQVDPLADPAQAAALVAALRQVGHLELAKEAANLALIGHGAGDDGSAVLRELRDDLRRELVFEAGLRRLVQRGYEGERRGEIRSLDDTLEALRELSQEVFGRDVVGQPRRLHLPFVGTLIDPSGPGLPAHLKRYNRHLVLGQFANKAVEGMIVTRLSVTRVASRPGLQMPAGTIEVVGEHRQLNPLHHADLAGIALLTHYVVDMDEVRIWAQTVRERRRIAREDEEVLLRDPIPDAAEELEPAGVAWRLGLRSPLTDADLTAAVLDVIRWHERGHMADFQYYLPWQRYLIRGALLLFRNNFDQLQVVAEGEGRAELCALAFSPHTRLVMAHIAGFLEGAAGSSPHAHGFRAITRDLIAGLRPKLGDRAAVRYWHECDPARLQAEARRLLQRPE